MDSNVQLLEQEERPALSIRTQTSVHDLSAELGKACQAIAQYAAVRGVTLDGPAFAAFHKMDQELLDVEIGFPVEHETIGHGSIQSTAIPKGLYVTCKHVGAYDELEPIYGEMNEYIAKEGLKPLGTAYEFYYNSTLEVEEKQLVTRVMLPVE